MMERNDVLLNLNKFIESLLKVLKTAFLTAEALRELRVCISLASSVVAGVQSHFSSYARTNDKCRIEGGLLDVHSTKRHGS